MMKNQVIITSLSYLKDEKGLNYEFIYRHKEAIFINTYDNSNNEYEGKHLQ